MQFIPRANDTRVVCLRLLDSAYRTRQTPVMSSNGQRLGEAVLARRRELDLTQLDVWQAGGPSNTTLTIIEKGDMENLTRTTARRLDKGLQWEQGSARAVWDGGRPAPLLGEGRLTSSESRTLRQAIESARDLDDETRDEMLRLLDGRDAG